MSSELPVKQVDVKTVDAKTFKNIFVGCVVMTHDNKILLQQRPDHWRTFPGYLAEFGGHIEKDETPIQALIRELHEELGAVANETDVISLGAVTEAATDYADLVYVYFWHDRNATITGCYEGQAMFYDSVSAALTHPKMMPGVRWLLMECEKKGLLPTE